MSSLTIHPSRRLRGTLSLPGDKSISHRALIFGSIAEGTTMVTNLLEADDVLRTVDAMRALGVPTKRRGKGVYQIKGVGLTGLRTPKKILDCGNSGTTLRLLTGLLAGSPARTTLTGDRSLNRRPMGRVIEPLRKMGAKIDEIRNRRGRYIKIEGRPLKGGIFQLPIASAQLKGALLLAGLVSRKRIIVSEPLKSRDHSERMLRGFGADVVVSDRRIVLNPVRHLRAQRILVPGDLSSAAFFIVAALVSPDPRTRVVIRNVGLNPSRTGILDLLRRMGAKIRLSHRQTLCGEPVGDVAVSPSRLRGIRVPRAIIPRVIDEIPILSVAAAVARGKTLIRGAEELRIKETDRIAALASELPRFGVPVREFPDGLEVTGTEWIRGARVRSFGDHRMAMAFTILGTIAERKTRVEDTACINTSLPEFVPLLKKLGGKIP